MNESDKAPMGAAAPLFIIRDVPGALAYYRDKLGFTVTFEGPEPDDIFFGMVERGNAMFMFKDVDVDPIPNRSRDIGHGIASWDAYVYVPDPDALFEEFVSRGADFSTQLGNNSDNLRGFEIRDPNGYIIYFGRPN